MLIIERRDTAKPRRIWAYSRPYGLFIRRNWDAKWANFGAWGRRLGAKPPPAPSVSPARPHGAIFVRPGGPTAGDALRIKMA